MTRRIRPAILAAIVLGAFVLLASDSPVLNFWGAVIAIFTPILVSLRWETPCGCVDCEARP